MLGAGRRSGINVRAAQGVSQSVDSSRCMTDLTLVIRLVNRHGSQVRQIVSTFRPGAVVILDVDAGFIAGGEMPARNVMEVVIAFGILLTVVFGRVIELEAKLQGIDLLDVSRTRASHVLPHRCDENKMERPTCHSTIGAGRAGRICLSMSAATQIMFRRCYVGLLAF